MREIKIEECEVTLVAEDETEHPRGCFDSGDPRRDEELVGDILRKLNGGDIWSWFCAKVTVTWNSLEETDYLGCCSYESEEDFKQKGGYYQGMVDECLGRIQERAEVIAKGMCSNRCE